MNASPDLRKTWARESVSYRIYLTELYRFLDCSPQNMGAVGKNVRGQNYVEYQIKGNFNHNPSRPVVFVIENFKNF